jgi:6-bladed beta-propeller
MRQAKYLLLPAVWALLAMALAATGRDSPSPAGATAGQKIDMRTEGGVTVVHNPKVPVPRPGGPSELLLTEDLVIGKDPAGEADIFAELRSIGVDDQERIWTLDWEDIKVRVFDKTGKLISTFGKKGQGPREWQSPSRMVVLPNGTAAVLDVNKLTFYSLDGICLKELSTARSRMARYRFDAEGNIYGDSFDFAPPKLKLGLVKYDPGLNKVKALAEIEEPLPTGGAFNAFTTLLYHHITAEDRVVWLVTSKYEFRVLDTEGNLLRRILKDHEPLNVTASDKKRILEERFGNSTVRDRIVFPDAFPPVSFFIGDAEGRLYVQTYEADAKGRLAHDVFDAEGRCFTRFFLPREEMPFVVKKSKLYVLILENEEGIPLLKRYAMSWK